MSDKLQFYKFYPSDWMMGRIQKCSGDCVKAFINFTCLYWNKECQVLIEDAKIELEEHYETLVKYKIIVEDNEWIKIKYLEEQNNEISEKTKSKSIDGRKGNLKRWHPELYSKVCDGKISLKQAEQIVKQLGSDSKEIAELSHSDGNPMATQSQNIADKDKDKDKDKIKNNSIVPNKLGTTPQKITNAQKKENAINEFREKVLPYRCEYDDETLKEFFEYWTESSENQVKVRYQTEKVFDVARRLKTWTSNNFKKTKTSTTQKDNINFILDVSRKAREITKEIEHYE